MISQSTIDKVKELDLVTVIEKYTKLTRKGANYSGKSPFNDERTGSFSINPGKQIWKCFSSHKGGKYPTDFIMQKESLSFIEAVEFLAKEHGIPIEYENWSDEKKEAYKKEQKARKQMQELLSFACAHFESQKLPQSFTKYRKFTLADLEPFQVGFASEAHQDLYNEAIKAGYDNDLLIKSGLVADGKNGKYDTLRNRIIFPILDIAGHVVAFTGRSADDNQKPKYYNSPDSLWQKSKHLYGLNVAKDLISKQGKAYLVEGNTDVIRMHKHGLPTVAACGSALTEDQIKLLKRLTDTVVIVPDNDFEPEKQANPGIESMHRSAMLMLQQGIHVKVLIPGDREKPYKTDPDEYLRKLHTPDEVKKWLLNEEDYISGYLLRECTEIASKGAKEKSDQIKRMGEVIEMINDDTLRGVYYDNIGKDWPDFKKGFKLKKRAEKVNIESLDKLKKDDRASFYDFGFFEKDGAYFTMSEKGRVRICNFTIEILYFVITSEEPKYVCRLQNMFGKQYITAITTDDFGTKATFSKVVGRFGNFIFEGNQTHLDKIRMKLFHGVKHAIEPKFMGYNPTGKYFTFSNGLYFDSKFYKTDKYGMVELTIPIRSMEDFKKLPPESQIRMGNDIFVLTFPSEFIEEHSEEIVQQYIDAGHAYKLNYHYLPFASNLKLTNQDESEDSYQFERMFHVRTNKAGEVDGITFSEWAKRIVEVYGDNGIIGIAFYIMAINRDIIYKANNSYIPMLGLFGPPQSGKSTLARSLCRMFGDCLPDGLSLENGSTATAANRYLASYSNAISWLNEYKNTLSDYILGMIKGIADGTGKLTGRKTSGNEIKVNKPRSTAILSGQDLPTKDAAIFNRQVICEFDGKNRKHAKLDELVKLEASGKTTAVTCELLQYRNLIAEHYPGTAARMFSELKQQYVEMEKRVEDRIINNIRSLMAPVLILMEQTSLQFPFTFDKLVEVIDERVEKQIAVQSVSNDVEQYFMILMSMAGRRELYEGEHFQLTKDSTGLVKLYLRTSSYHANYQAAAKRSDMVPMQIGSIQSYLEKHHSYLGKEKNVRFKNLKNPTSAHVFDYNQLLEEGIEFSTHDSIEEMVPSLNKSM